MDWIRTFWLVGKVEGRIGMTNCTGVEHYGDFLFSGNYNDATWSVTGCEPTNQTILGLRAFTYFYIFIGVELESVKSQLDWFNGGDVDDRATSMTTRGRAT